MQNKKDFTAILLHTVFAVTLCTTLLSGLQIATLTRVELQPLKAILPQGLVHSWHLLGASGVLAVFITFILFKQYKKTKISLLAYFIFYAAIGSGAALYYGVLPSLFTPTLHYCFSILFTAWIVLHIYNKTVKQPLKAYLLPSTYKGFAGKKTLLILLVAVGAFFAVQEIINKTNTHTLKVRKISNNIKINIDAKADEEAWKEAEKLTIHTFGGENFIHGATDITVEALHNDTEIYFHISWADPTKSTIHLPLVKTKKGWTIAQHGLYNFNETKYYEDKLAVMFSKQPSFGGAKTAHLGSKPLKNKPANWHKKGYHYSSDGTIMDLWHWKATRSNHMHLATDSYFGLPTQPQVAQRRYTAGYHSDPKLSGGFTMNYKWYKKEYIVPKRLPAERGTLKKYQNYSTNLQWMLPWYDTIPYSKQADTYPVGTVMPSVLYTSNRYEGDIADVQAYGAYNNGKWSVEFVRFLKTDSKFDLELKSGIYMWISAFDHAQVGHTRHNRAIKLELQ